MPPRFLERLERQSQIYRQVFNQPEGDPPPYLSSVKSPRSSVDTQRTSISQSTTFQIPPPEYCASICSSNARDFEAEKPALPPNSLILVTGASGFQGSHIVDQLLAQGYRVRGTVRDAEKALWTNKFFKEKYGPSRYTTTIVPEMVPRDAFDLAVRGCSGVVHCAAVMTFSPDPTQVIPPTIAGALNALEAAAREPNVSRFVYCSSTTAAAGEGLGACGGATSDSWNMSAFLDAWKHPPYKRDRAWAVFSSSKLQTEQAVWRWYSEHRPQFILNCVLPACLWGHTLSPPHQGYPSAVGLLKQIWDGDAKATAWAPPQHFVDVQDSALIHIAALLSQDVFNSRIFAANTPYNVNSILDLLRVLYPEREFMGAVSDDGLESTVFLEAGLGEQLLKRMGKFEGYADMETSLLRTVNCWL